MGNVRYTLEPIGSDWVNSSLIYFTSSTYEGDWASIRHTHSFSELFFVKSGSGRFFADDAEFDVTQDDIVIINPYVEHAEISAGPQPLDYIVLAVDGISFDFGSKSKTHTMLSLKKYREDFMFVFNTMEKELASGETLGSTVCQSLLNVVLVKLIRVATHPIALSDEPMFSKECERVKRYIDSNYASEISLESLAEIAHLSKFYLAHSFTKSYGISPINYLSQKRIKVSCELLRTTDYSIGQIAQCTGFSSQSYFSQSFKRFCDMKPNEYRKKMREV